MPQKRKKYNFTSTVQANENARTSKAKQNERQWLKKGENVLFSNEELQEVKTILKRKHLAKTPALISATVLNKCKVIESILKKNDDVNEPDETGSTALIWGVKTKQLEATKLLLKAPNICLKSDAFDHIVFVALSLPNWNENEFYSLWTNVKALYPVGVNILSKDGRSMLHYAVKREWMGFINILISENADINIQDINGMTPIMLACVKRNLKIIECFIEHSVDVIAEDSYGLTALCYIISVFVTIKNPNFGITRFLDGIQVPNLKSYIKTRLDLIVDGPSTLYANEPSVILQDVFKYFINIRSNGLEHLLELDVLRKLKEGIAVDNTNNLPKLRFIFVLAWELFKQTSATKDIASLFVSEGCLNTFLTIAHKYRVGVGVEPMAKMVLKAIINTTTASQSGQIWLESSFELLHEILKPLPEEDLCKILNSKDDIWHCDVSKIKSFLEGIKILCANRAICTSRKCNVKQPHDDNQTRNTKKGKRHSKALKVKLQKIKNAELLERLHTKKSCEVEVKSDEDLEGLEIVDNSNKELCPMERIKYAKASQSGSKSRNETPHRKPGPKFKIYINPNEEAAKKYFETSECGLVNAIKNSILLKNPIKPSTSKSSTNIENGSQKTTSDWESVVTNLPFTSVNKTTRQLIQDMINYGDPRLYSQLYAAKADSHEHLLPTINYLTSLLDKIVHEYKVNWQIDEELDREVFKSDKEEADLQKIINKLKEDKMQTLKLVFYDMIAHIKDMSRKDAKETISLINGLEELLLNHEIRGKTIKETVAASETIDVKVEFLNQYSLIPNYEIEKYMEDVLNNKRKPAENVVIKVTEPIQEECPQYYSADLMYLQEIRQLPPKAPVNPQKMQKSKVETLKHSYHLVNSIMKICDSDEENTNDDSTQKTSTSSKSTSCDGTPKKISRWCPLLSSLKLMKDLQTFLDGNVRISCQRKRTTHVISTGGNFTPVELGLDASDNPMAVKRIPIGSAVCTLLKDVISEMMDVKHANLLHYCVCDYDKTELILATPLCEFNIGQYLMLMRQKKTTFLTTLEIVTQVLNGILFLHDRPSPIIHGNLKPSNIFVDLSGKVKLAEFGIHEALFRLKEAPNSSVIWFATETYNNFKQTSVLESTLESDIQVVGMLMHFIFTGGTHAYGVEAKDILKNLEKSLPQLACNDLEMQDLLTWMLLFFPAERPNIQQVLSHVYFWSVEKRWQFILTCSGVTASGADVQLDLETFHKAIDKIAHKDNIKGNWVQVMKQVVPNLSTSEDDDSATGLLKFINSCFKNMPPSIEFKSDFERCNFFITSFPTLPLSLFRMLESTDWSSHSVFLPFTIHK